MTYQALVTNLEKSKNQRNDLYVFFIYPYESWGASLIILHDGRNVAVFGVN